MKARHLALGCAIAALTFSAGVAANEIYKWVDEDGNVHYEDRPSGATSEERLALTYSRTNNSVVSSRVKARHDAQAAREEARSQAATAEKEAADQAAEAAERQQACERARARLETYVQSPRLYRTDDNGERVYLDDAQRQEARAKAEQRVTEYCG